jgi:hypothetical protein
MLSDGVWASRECRSTGHLLPVAAFCGHTASGSLLFLKLQFRMTLEEPAALHLVAPRLNRGLFVETRQIGLVVFFRNFDGHIRRLLPACVPSVSCVLASRINRRNASFTDSSSGKA